MKVFDVETMRMLDNITIQRIGIPGEILMERAGIGAGEMILDFVYKLNPSFSRRFIILTGSGNNGGDGFVISRYLAKMTNNEIWVYTVADIKSLKSPTAAFHAALIPESVNVSDVENLSIKDSDIIIDCLLGTGFKGILKEPYNNIIKKINESGNTVIAIDIPSGLNGDDGSNDGLAIKADMTITIGYPKIGFFKNNGPSYCGIIKVLDIGINDNNMKSLLDTVFIDDVRRMIPEIAFNVHKNSRGSVLILGGCSLYGGAPFLSGLSALRAGAGMCRVITPNKDINNSKLALIIKRINDDYGYFRESGFDLIHEEIEKSDSIVIGPGMGTDEQSVKFLEKVLSLDKKIVIDADALNIISNNRHIFKNNGCQVMTPHPREMKRLLKSFGLDEYLNKERHLQAVKLAETTGSYVVLKGFHSIIAAPDGNWRLNCSGNQNLATAGSGDCLSGVIAAFLNRISDPYDAISSAVFIHGLAGEMSSFGTGTIADDLPELIAGAIKEI